MGNSQRPPVSVLLPTREWGAVCSQLAAQLRPGDELLVVCDTDSDPVAQYNPSDRVKILIAGEPEGCTGKANAVAHAMEQATNDRFVWSDDDYARSDDWLDRIVELGEARGPAAFEPLIVSEGIWFKLLEPTAALGIALYDVYRDGGEGGYPWAGGVTFSRDELTGSVEQLCSELRQSVSDDNALDNYLTDTYTPRDWNIRIPVEGDFTDMRRRLTRWMRAGHVRYNRTPEFVASMVIAGVSLLFPMIVAPLVTVLAGFCYNKLGYSRWTFLLGYPALLFLPAIFAVGIFRSEFVWGERRYRVNALYDVEVCNSASGS